MRALLRLSGMEERERGSGWARWMSGGCLAALRREGEVRGWYRYMMMQEEEHGSEDTRWKGR
jgi:hypothetical protein